MLRSMYSGISGMKVNQVKLDVIGNNISNVGTTGFKSSRARFSDMMRQNVSDAMSPSMNQGGKNASQVGLGVQLASIDTVMTQGMMQPTGRALDVGIDGDGFFVVSKGPTSYGNDLSVSHTPGTHTLTQLGNASSDIMYSRDGSFILDRDGNLLTGDGFRVMGYSLTNDDNGEEATSKSPNSVSSAGIDVRFGPGSQLNEYKVVLGNVGPGTVTSLDVNKANKILVLNGDFSRDSGLTTEQIEIAMNKGLSSAGISQRVSVSGTPIAVDKLSSDKIIGGTDNEAPATISLSGATIKFGPGSALNGFKFRIEHDNTLSKATAVVDGTDKEIVIKTNLLDEEKINGEALAKIINKELKAQGIDQEVIMTGNINPLKGLKGKTSGGKDPVQAKVETTDSTNEMPIKFEINGTSIFNGYTINCSIVDNIDSNVEISSSSNDITVKIQKGKNVTEDELNTALEKALKNKYDKEQIKISIPNGIDTSKETKFAASKVSGGAAAVAPKKVDIRGLSFEFPEGEKYNDIEIAISDIEGNRKPPVDVIVNSNGKIEKIEISANFLDPMGVPNGDIKGELDKALTGKGIKDLDIIVSGTGRIDSDELKSGEIEGGTDVKSPDSVSVFGFDININPGASLNNYKIQIGKVTAGTKTEAVIDQKGKIITINGDFVNEGKVDAQSLQNVINIALKNAGINQGVTITGESQTVPSAESEYIEGGTPVQSINKDGVVNYVNGGGEIKSYDTELKTLKIPDKVRVPGPTQGEDIELRVKSYAIDKNGIITGVLEDGRVAALGQIAMASFKNPEGLTSLGGNLYSGSVNSGEAIIKSGVGTLGEDNSKGYGDNLQGMLEMSNVDLSEQFTEMIVTTRAFQASGKMITTGDEILQDIINLKR